MATIYRSKKLFGEIGFKENSPEFVACVKFLETIKPKEANPKYVVPPTESPRRPERLNIVEGNKKTDETEEEDKFQDNWNKTGEDEKNKKRRLQAEKSNWSRRRKKENKQQRESTPTTYEENSRTETLRLSSHRDTINSFTVLKTLKTQISKSGASSWCVYIIRYYTEAMLHFAHTSENRYWEKLNE